MHLIICHMSIYHIPFFHQEINSTPGSHKAGGSFSKDYQYDKLDETIQA
jgi:hypothetical protein